jgi:hypothetical protein
MFDCGLFALGVPTEEHNVIEARVGVVAVGPEPEQDPIPTLIGPTILG